MSEAALHDELLGFGKHRDKTFRQTAELDDIVKWALAIPKPKGRLEMFVTYLRQHHADKAAAVGAPGNDPQSRAASAPPRAAGGSDEEEGQPLSARTAGSKRAPPNTAVPSSAVKVADPAAAGKAEESSEDEAPLAARASAAGKAKESSEDEAPLAARATAAGKAKAENAKRRQQQQREEEEQESSEDEAPLAARAAAGAKAKAAKTQAKRADEEDKEDDDEDDGTLSSKEAIAMAVRFAGAVIARGERGDAEGVLSVLGVNITKDTPVEEMRKAYRALARMLHPDKLGRHFPGATKAFQTLTSAFDALTAPEASPAEAKRKGKKSAPTVGRSNDNCFRTKVSCPRCAARWGTPDSGLQPYEYTFMMQGLRTYVCCGCLLEFGCMSAAHHCPHCQAEIHYHPRKYHDQVKCMKCKASFGFKLYTTGPVVEARLREHILEKAAKRQKRFDSGASRQQRRPLEVPAEQKRAHDELLYRVGLVDCCPRCGSREACGEGAPDGAAGEAARARHLRACTDEAEHRRYARKLAGEQGERDRKQMLQARQEEVERHAQWKFLGGDAARAWMLTDKQLEEEAASAGLDPSGGREATLAQLAMKEAEAGAAGPGGASSSAAAAATMPENLESLSLEALRAVAAAHGVRPPPGSTKDEVIHLLERNNGTMHALEFGKKQGDRMDLLLTGKMDAAGDEDDDEAAGDAEWKGGAAGGGDEDDENDDDDDDDDDDGDAGM